MRIESSITSISWIPSEAISGHTRLPMDLGIGRYDDPPPDRLDDLRAMEAQGRFRFANELRAAIEVDDDGHIGDVEHGGCSYICTTDVHLGERRLASFAPVAFPDLRRAPVVGDGWVRFEQTAGGRTGAPLPRRVRRPPYVRITAPVAWTTLRLVLHADGRVDREVAGASAFPRHWIYDHDRRLFAKSGLTDFQSWSRTDVGDDTPWGDVDAPVLVTAVETALERRLSLQIMRTGARPEIRRFDAGAELMVQGDEGDELFVLLDGVVVVHVDGEALVELGPGAVLGERAVLEGGRRTASVTARTPAKVAAAAVDDIDRAALVELARDHRREERVS